MEPRTKSLLYLYSTSVLSDHDMQNVLKKIFLRNNWNYEYQKKDYDNLCYTCSVLLVGVNGNLEKYETYSTGYIESAIKITKNYSGPKIQYLIGTGLMKIHSGQKLEEVDFKLFGAEASVHHSAHGAGTYSIISQN